MWSSILITLSCGFYVGLGSQFWNIVEAWTLSSSLSDSHYFSFITSFLILVCLACTNSCPHPVGYWRLCRSSHCFPSSLGSISCPPTLFTLLLSVYCLFFLLLMALSPPRVFLLDLCMSCSFSPMCTFHPPPISYEQTFFSLHVCYLWWSPPLIPLLLISSAHGPIFCCCQIQARTGHN